LVESVKEKVYLQGVCKTCGRPFVLDLSGPHQAWEVDYCSYTCYNPVSAWLDEAPPIDILDQLIKSLE
jgi:hypothetical protein